MRKGNEMKKVIGRIIKILAVIYGVLFAVFYFDLDGKFLYYIFEPLMVKRFDKMERKDNTQTPYEMKESVSESEGRSF